MKYCIGLHESKLKISDVQRKLRPYQADESIVLLDIRTVNEVYDIGFKP